MTEDVTDSRDGGLEFDKQRSAGMPKAMNRDPI